MAAPRASRTTAAATGPGRPALLRAGLIESDGRGRGRGAPSASPGEAPGSDNGTFRPSGGRARWVGRLGLDGGGAAGPVRRRQRAPAAAPDPDLVGERSSTTVQTVVVPRRLGLGRGGVGGSGGLCPRTPPPRGGQGHRQPREPAVATGCAPRASPPHPERAEARRCTVTWSSPQRDLVTTNGEAGALRSGWERVGDANLWCFNDSRGRELDGPRRGNHHGAEGRRAEAPPRRRALGRGSVDAGPAICARCPFTCPTPTASSRGPAGRPGTKHGAPAGTTAPPGHVFVVGGVGEDLPAQVPQAQHAATNAATCRHRNIRPTTGISYQMPPLGPPVG